MFMVLFMTAGIGNGSTFHMIPAIFLKVRQHEAAGRARQLRRQAVRDANTERGRAWRFFGDCRIRRLLHPMSYGASISVTARRNRAVRIHLSTDMHRGDVVFYSRRSAEIKYDRFPASTSI